jgi:ppGpp synthetase/RelA/SpoT-type nucleotidyltranferase
MKDFKYISKDEIISIKTKDSKIISNYGRFINNGSDDTILSGLYISKNAVNDTIIENQISLFKKGGLMPDSARYIARYNIEEVVYGDEEDPMTINGKFVANGFWVENEKQLRLIKEAEKQGRLKNGGKIFLSKEVDLISNNAINYSYDKNKNNIGGIQYELTYKLGGNINNNDRKLSPIQRYVLEIEGISGVKKITIEKFIKDNKLNQTEVLNIVIGLGRKQLSSVDFITALLGDKKNNYIKKVIDFSKSDKAFKLANGGLTDRKVIIFNEGVIFDKKKYKAIFQDYDKDGIVNVDDANPLKKNKKTTVEEVMFSETFEKLLEIKKELDGVMNQTIKELDKKAPKNAEIYARTKTPFSILKKLVDKRLISKNGLTDLVGTTIAVDTYKELLEVVNFFDEGKFGKIIEKEDMYSKPKDGYRAFHYIIETKGYPVEVQLKTKRNKKIDEFSHPFYKNGNMNKENLLKLSDLANKADKGDLISAKEIDDLLKNKIKINSMLKS